MPEQAIRIAAILTIIEDDDAPNIPSQFIAGGIELVQFYCSEALRLFEASRVNDTLFESQVLLDWLQYSCKGPFISIPDISQRGPISIRTKKIAEKLVAILLERGWLRLKKEGARINENNRREAWFIVRDIE